MKFYDLIELLEDLSCDINYEHDCKMAIKYLMSIREQVRLEMSKEFFDGGDN